MTANRDRGNNNPRPSTAKQRLERLRELARTTGPAFYEKVQLAAELLADREFLIDRYGGDEAKAVEEFETAYFPEVASIISLVKLVDCYQLFPFDKWKEWQFSYKKLLVEWDKSRQAEKPASRRDEADASEGEATEKPRRPTWEMVREAEAKGEDKGKAEVQQEFVPQVRSLQEENRALREKVQHLQIALAKAEGRIHELEKQLKRVAA